MNYHAPTNQFTIDQKSMQRASYLFLHAISKIRKQSDLSLSGYDAWNRVSDNAEYAEGDILDAAKELGIDLGATRPGKLNVTNIDS